MILVPLWTKDIEDWPTLAVALVGVTLLVFLLTWPRQVRLAHKVNLDDLRRSAEHLALIAEAPGAGLDSTLGVRPAESDVGKADDPFCLWLDRIQENRAQLSPGARYEWDIAYPVYDSYREAIRAGAEVVTPFQKWGFSPARQWWPGLVTHIFLHEGWLHLLTNLLFLWIAAAIAEGVMGIHVLWVYVTCGVAGALAQVQSGLPGDAVLVGASGGISGLMGFCLLAKPTVRIRLFYLLILILTPRYGFLDGPVWVFVPLWFMAQFVMALSSTSGMAIQVGHAAHIGGFIFGGLVGLVWRSFGAKAP